MRRGEHLPAPPEKEQMQGVRRGKHLPAQPHKELVQDVPSRQGRLDAARSRGAIVLSLTDSCTVIYIIIIALVQIPLWLQFSPRASTQLCLDGAPLLPCARNAQLPSWVEFVFQLCFTYNIVHPNANLGDSAANLERRRLSSVWREIAHQKIVGFSFSTCSMVGSVLLSSGACS